MDTSKAIGVGVAGLAALGLGITGASMSSAETGSSSSSSTSGSSTATDAPSTQDPQARVDDGRELSADAASKAIAAAEAKEPDATVKGVHLDRDGGGYEVTMLRTDATMVEVVVDDSFSVTEVEERDGRGPGGHGPGGHGHGPGGPGERPDAPSQDGQQAPDDASTPSSSATSAS